MVKKNYYQSRYVSQALVLLPLKLPNKILDKTTISKKSKNIYGNVPKGGCDSTAEYKRYMYLLERERVGEIRSLRKHVLYRFARGAYEADFVYVEDGVVIVEDVKHPILLHQRKFIVNKRKMLLEHGLKVHAIHPNKVYLEREKAIYN